MIQWVYESMVKGIEGDFNVEVFVVTDDEQILNAVEGFGGNALMVKDDVPSGSERIHLAFERHLANGNNCDLIVNVQGDEPLLKIESVIELAKFHLESDFEIGTLVRKRSRSEEDFKNSNCVKVAMNTSTGRCLYFSRSPIPFDRDNNSNEWFHHLGVYSYKPEALKSFNELPAGELEKTEALEQLRALENGLSIGAKEINYKLQGVDVPEDIKLVEELLRG